MVHGIEVLKVLNERQKPRKEESKSNVPPHIGLNPALARKYVNRPWTEQELKGQQDVYKTYAEGAAAPFGKKEVQEEGIRQ